jgi:beta-ureidopropionase / N-carbamoyl-L-amino-acid hydrolase
VGRVSPDAIRDKVYGQRPLVERLFEELADGSRGNPGITRDTYGPGEDFGHRLVSRCARELGLEIDTDAAANTYMTLPGRDRTAPKVLIGSHLDSVPHGGNFDGAAGVVAGLASVAALNELGIRPTCDVSVMGIRAEESVWFQVSYIGSRSALGMLPDGALQSRRIDTQRTLADHMGQSGGDPEAVREGRRSLDPTAIRAFFELHIEQAPSLVEAGRPIAIATGIPANFRYPNARVLGRYDHVGTPRRFRHDAVAAAIELASELDGAWEEHELAGIPMALTFGRFYTDAAAHGLTTVAGECHFSLDVRAYEPAVLTAFEARMFRVIGEIENRKKVEFVLGERAHAPVGRMSPQIVAALEAGVTALGIPAIPIGSPASHDAAAFANAKVPVAMILIRNENGSHNPLEQMRTEDFLDGTSLLVWWLVNHLDE